MARDLGTAVLNIKIALGKLNTAQVNAKLKEFKEQVAKRLDMNQGLMNKAGDNLVKNYIAGIVAGIKSRSAQVERAGRSLAKYLHVATKKGLEIQSPSKKAIQLGKQYTDGLIQGIDAGMGAVKGTVNRHLSELVNAGNEVKRLKILIKGILGKGTLTASDVTALDQLNLALKNAESTLKRIKAEAKTRPSIATKTKADVQREIRAEKEQAGASDSLQRRAGGVRGVLRDLRLYIAELDKAGKSTKNFAAFVDSSSNRFSNFFSSLVKSAKQTKDFTAANKELDSQILKLRSAIGKMLPTGKQKTAILAAITEQADKARAALQKLEAIEKAKPSAEKAKAENKLKKQAAETTKAKAALVELINTLKVAGITTSNFKTALEGTSVIASKLFDRYASGAKKLDTLKASYDLINNASAALVKQIISETRAGKAQAKMLAEVEKARLAAVKAAGANFSQKQIRDAVDDSAVRLKTRDQSVIKDEIQKLKILQRMFKAAGADVTLLSRAIKKAEHNLSELVSAQKRQRLENIRRTFHSITSGVNQTGEQLRRVSFILRDVGRQMMMFGRRGFSLLGGAATEFLEFEQAVVDILAVTGDLNVGMEKTGAAASDLGKFILDLAGETRFSANEIAESGKTLALAGFSSQQVMDSLRAMTALAAATGSRLAETTNLIVSTVSTFQIEAADAVKVADIFAAAVTRSNMSVVQLSEAMKIVAPTAAAMNQEISQTAAALGILANAGLKGTLAGTGYSRVLTQLVEKSSKLEGMLVGLGSSFENINPEQVGIVEIVREFERLNLSTAQLLDIFDLRAFRSIQAIMAQGSDSLEQLSDALENASGLAEFLAKNRLTTLAAGFELVSDAVSALRISLVELVSGEVKQATRLLLETLDSIREAVSNNKETVKALIQTFIGFATVLSSLGITLFSLGAAFSFIAAPLIAMGAGLAAVNSVISTAVTMIGVFELTLAALGPMLLGVVGAFSVLAAAISAMTAAVTLSVSALSIAVFQNFDLTKQYLEQWVSDIFSSIDQFVMYFTAGWNSGFAEFRAAFEGVLVELTKFGIELESSFGGTFAETLGSVLISALTLALIGVRQFISILSLLIPIVERVSSGVFYLFKSLETLSPVFSVLWDFVSNAVGLLVKYELAMLALPAAIYAVSAALSALMPALAAVSAFMLANPVGLIVLAVTAAFMALDRFIFGWSEGLAKANAALDEAIKKMAELRTNLDKMAKESVAGIQVEVALKSSQSEEVVTNIKKQIETLRNSATVGTEELAAATSKSELEKILQDVKDGMELFRSLRNEVAQKASDALALGLDEEAARYRESLAKIDAQLNRLLDTYNQYETILAQVNTALSGNSEEIDRALSAETKRSKELADLLQGFARNASAISGEDSFNAFTTQTEGGIEFFGVLETVDGLVDQLNETMGTNFEMTSWESFQEIVEFVSTEGKDALKNAQDMVAQLKVAQALATEQGGIDLSTPEGQAERDRRMNDAKTYLELAKQQGKDSEHRKNLETVIAELQKEGLSDFEMSLSVLDEELQKRRDVIESQRTYLRLQEIIIENELKSTSLTEEQRKAKEASLAAVRKEAEEMQGIAESMAESDKKRREQMMEEQIQDSKKTLDELQLETEKNVDERIRIRQRLAEARRKKELEDAKKQLQGVFSGNELAEMEKSLDKASDAALAQDKMAIAEEEKEKAGQAAKRTVEKRVDLETSILDTLGKQVTTLQQMAMLIQFIEALERRKDNNAMKSMRELNKERMKLRKMEEEAILKPGGVAAMGLDGQREKVGFLEGKVARDKDLAGVGMGNPAGIFNIGAFFATLNAELQNFVNKLKENPVIIPAKFDIESLARDLTEAWKQAKIDGLFSNIPRINPNGIAFNGGAAAGNSLVNNDNSTINVNVQRLPEEIARKLAIV